MPPRGGPRDRTPPTLRTADPQPDAVNVPTDTREIRLAFSEYVERSSLVQSLSITPPLEGRLAFDWDGTDVTLELPETLRDSTTYILTIDTNLSDTRGVALEEPITLAFSTGPRISRGELRGRIVTPAQGAPQGRVDVYAYALPDTTDRLPDPLPERPEYRTQSGEDGTFAFEYLRERSYVVLAVRDVNRNRQVEASEARAVPPVFRVTARPGAEPFDAPWVLAPIDTTRPSVQRVRTSSNRRVEVRLSEPIRLDTLRPSMWVLRDSLTNRRLSIDGVYTLPNTPRSLRIRTAEDMRPERHRLRIPGAAVRDTLGQPLADTTVGFRPVASPDTLQTRFRTFLPRIEAPDSTGAYPLLPDAEPAIRFNQPVDSILLRQVVSVQDTSGASQAFTTHTADGVTYRLFPSDSLLAPGGFMDVSVRQRPLTGRDTTLRRRYRRLTDRALGGLEGELALPDGRLATRSIHADSIHADSVSPGSSIGPRGIVEAIPVAPSLPMETRRVTVAPGSTFVIQSLPEGRFRFRAFIDRNDNGTWDAGTLHPYRPPEPLTWSAEPTDSRPRWINVLGSPLRFPTVDLSASPDAAVVPADTTEALGE